MCEYKVKQQDVLYVNKEVCGGMFGYKIVDKKNCNTIKIRYLRSIEDPDDYVIDSYQILCFNYPNDHEIIWCISVQRKEEFNDDEKVLKTIVSFCNRVENEVYRFPVQFADQSRKQWHEFTSKIKTQQWIKEVYDYLDNLIVTLNEKGFNFHEPWIDMYLSYKEFKENW